MKFAVAKFAAVGPWIREQQLMILGVYFFGFAFGLMGAAKYELAAAVFACAIMTCVAELYRRSTADWRRLYDMKSDHYAKLFTESMFVVQHLANAIQPDHQAPTRH